MLPNDEPSRQAQKLRARQRLLAALLGFCALGSSAMYLVFLRSLGWAVLTLLILLEWVVMFFIYLMATSQMRRRR
jgi:hypothetical protein